MTSSEPMPPAGAGPAPQQAEPPPKPVLAQGHLHPAILFLRLWEGFRRMAFFLVLGLLVDRLFLLVALVPFLLQMVYGLAAYLTVQYVLTADELVVREGILHRQERRIPVDRIQDLAFESTLLRRMLGLVVVRVETASGKGSEAQLDSLGRVGAAQLREVLLQARVARGLRRTAGAGDGEDAAAAPAPPVEEHLVYAATPGELLLRGLTDLRASAVFVTAFAALELADQFGFVGRLQGLAGSVVDWLGRLPPVAITALLLALAVGVLAVGATMAVAGNVVRFWGFQMSLREDVLLRRYGLLTTRQKTLPRLRIQRVTLEMTWLRRPFGLCAVRADSASSGFSESEDQKTGWDLVVPLTRRPQADALLPVLLPGLDPSAIGWRAVSPRLVERMTLEGTVAAVLLAVPGWFWVGPWALLALLLVPLLWAVAQLVWRNFAWATPAGFLCLRRGILGRYLAFIPLHKVQSVMLAAGPLDRLFGLAELTVHVAGGSPTTLSNLTRGDAEALRELVARAAADAARRDWGLAVPAGA